MKNRSFTFERILLEKNPVANWIGFQTQTLISQEKEISESALQYTIWKPYSSNCTLFKFVVPSTSILRGKSVSSQLAWRYALSAKLTTPEYPYAKSLWRYMFSPRRTLKASWSVTLIPRQWYFRIWCRGWYSERCRSLLTQKGSMRRWVFARCSTIWL